MKDKLSIIAFATLYVVGLVVFGISLKFQMTNAFHWSYLLGMAAGLTIGVIGRLKLKTI